MVDKGVRAAQPWFLSGFAARARSSDAKVWRKGLLGGARVDKDTRSSARVVSAAGSRQFSSSS